MSADGARHDELRATARDPTDAADKKPTPSPVLAVLHWWLRPSHFTVSKQLLLDAVGWAPDSRLPSVEDATVSSSSVVFVVDVEWAGSGIVIQRGLRVDMRAAAAAGPLETLRDDGLVLNSPTTTTTTAITAVGGNRVDDLGTPGPADPGGDGIRDVHSSSEAAATAARVFALQAAVAPFLGLSAPTAGHFDLSAPTAGPFDVRLFAGQGGPELTWPDLAWYPDLVRPPPPEAVQALQQLGLGQRRNGRATAVLVATRGQFVARRRKIEAAEKRCKRISRSEMAELRNMLATADPRAIMTRLGLHPLHRPYCYDLREETEEEVGVVEAGGGGGSRGGNGGAQVQRAGEGDKVSTREEDSVRHRRDLAGSSANPFSIVILVYAMEHQLPSLNVLVEFGDAIL